jgi:lysyl-tRNA synthetase class 2
VYSLDEDFLAALPHIQEPTSGIALGVDRLIMVLAGTRKIEDVVALPFEG